MMQLNLLEGESSLGNMLNTTSHAEKTTMLIPNNREGTKN
jgi:hypothetical protein